MELGCFITRPYRRTCEDVLRSVCIDLYRLTNNGLVAEEEKRFLLLWIQQIIGLRV